MNAIPKITHMYNEITDIKKKPHTDLSCIKNDVSSALFNVKRKLLGVERGANLCKILTENIKDIWIEEKVHELHDSRRNNWYLLKEDWKWLFSDKVNLYKTNSNV